MRRNQAILKRLVEFKRRYPHTPPLAFTAANSWSDSW